jgi:peptide/nickel transport system substrate-binding protein
MLFSVSGLSFCFPIDVDLLMVPPMKLPSNFVPVRLARAAARRVALISSMAIGLTFGLTAGANDAQAQELVLALSTPITSIDPHYHNLTPNNALARHYFDALISTDEFQNLVPGLAVSWRTVNETTWEFKLRKGVKWHDGSAFTAEDVLATLKRAPNVPNSPASFAAFVRPIIEATAADSHTLIFKTAKPHPLLPIEISNVMIVPKAIAETAKTEDFNSGKAAIGTGPFKFVDYKAGDRVVLARNDAYWGPKPAWAKVQQRMISNSAARVAALLASDVQLIENVPTTDAENLRANKNLRLGEVVSNRLIYLHMDTGREKNSPFIRTKDGKPMEANPLRDVRVRKAISMALNRDAIVDRVMEKMAVPAGQLLPEQFFGTSKRLKPEKFDPEAAKKLLAEAGYPNGFQMTLHAPNNRYINDEKIAQAVAQYLTRIGIDTKLESMPSAIFFTRGTKLEFSFMLAGWSSSTGDTSSPLRSLLGTFDPAIGSGSANRGRFSDPGLDAMVSTALTQVDDTKRGMLLAAASEKAVALLGLIPVHYEVSVWGMRKNISYKARADQYTLAQDIKPAK